MEAKLNRCQKCGKSFDSLLKYRKHLTSFHNADSDSNSEEFQLLRKIEAQEKARKRTRGPYRKSVLI